MWSAAGPSTAEQWQDLYTAAPPAPVLSISLWEGPDADVIAVGDNGGCGGRAVHASWCRMGCSVSVQGHHLVAARWQVRMNCQRGKRSQRRPKTRPIVEFSNRKLESK